MRKMDKDDYLLFTKLCLNNLNEKPSVFVNKALEIDLIKNKFSKNTIYNNFLYFKRYMSDGYKCVAMPKDFCKSIDSLTKKVKNIECTKPKVITAQSYEDIEKFFNEQYESLNEKCNKIREDVELQLSILNNKLRDLDKYYENKCKEIQERREVLIREFFERS